MEQRLRKYLKSRKTVQISLTELQSIFPGETDYFQFAELIKRMEAEGVLRPVKKHHTNNKPIPLYHTYRINRGVFKDELLDHIQVKVLQVHESIKLQAYYSLSQQVWEKDFPYIQKIDQYIQRNGFPEKEASAPERSYEILGDEKWIDFKGGKALLSRIGLWDKLKITYNVDPLMMAVNLKGIHQVEHFHLVVENKATFHDCLESLKMSPLTALVYGAGWKIVSNLVLLPKQLSLENGENQILYFGDLDYEGISIWYMLQEKEVIPPAVPFYKALLGKPATYGKESQRKNPKALEHFITYFSQEEGDRIKSLLASGCYYPQEGLNREEIKSIWRHVHGG